MRTIQKKINFNHGMITPELIERTDLDIYDKSAALLLNMTPVIFGGVRTRRGTVRCDRLFFNDNASLVGTATSSIMDTAKLQAFGEISQSRAIGGVRELFRIDYTTMIAGATFNIKGLKLDFEMPSIKINPGYTLVINTTRPGSTGRPGTSQRWTYTTFTVANPGRGYRASDWRSGAIQNVGVNELGQLTTLSPNRIEAAFSGGYNVVRLGVPRSETVLVQVSADGETWHDVGPLVLTESAQDFTVGTMESFRYVRLYRESDDILATSFSMTMFNANSSGSPLGINSVRAFPYIYNADIKYLIVLGNKNIFIYRDGKLVQQLFTTVITEDILEKIQMTAKDDTVIFVHPSIPPQRLMRIGENAFNFAEYPLRGIPYGLFGDEKSETKTTQITPSATDGNVILTGSGFTANMVGQYIDGGGARVKIVEFISSTQLRVRTIIPFYNTSAITSWKYIYGYEPVWSATRGWPRAALFVEQRLGFAGSRDLPAGLWFSRIGDYNNFQNIGNYDNDGFEWPLDTNSAIVNIIAQRNMHIMTSGEEWTVPEKVFAPTKFTASKMSSVGCWGKTPAVAYNNAVLMIDRTGQNLYYYGYNGDDGGFIPKNISLYFRYDGVPVDLTLEKNSVADKGDFLYCLMDSGKMCVQALGLSENINAPCIFETDGHIMAVCAVADDVYLIVRRGVHVFVERLSDTKLDCANTVHIVNKYIDNLDEFAGRRIIVEQNGRAIAKKVPNDGVLEIKELQDGPAVIGLPFKYKIVSNPISIGGRTTSVRKRINRAVVECLDTAKIQLNDQLLSNCDTYEFFAVSAFERDCRYEITGEYTPIRILSIQLDISYEG